MTWRRNGITCLPCSLLRLLPRIFFLLIFLQLTLLGGGRVPGQALAQTDGDRAILEVVLYDPVEGGGYSTRSYRLVGMFSVAGASTGAEGRIIQVSVCTLCLRTFCYTNHVAVAPA